VELNIFPQPPVPSWRRVWLQTHLYFCSYCMWVLQDHTLVRQQKHWCCFFNDCKSVHHRTIQINHQPDATIFQFIILTFIYSPTCFGRSPAHHQELNDCNSSLWFYLRIVVTVVLCSWFQSQCIRIIDCDNLTTTKGTWLAVIWCRLPSFMIFCQLFDHWLWEAYLRFFFWLNWPGLKKYHPLSCSAHSLLVIFDFIRLFLHSAHDFLNQISRIFRMAFCSWRQQTADSLSLFVLTIVPD
jgi:hypothetical protein